jgi:hypothetical protein
MPLLQELERPIDEAMVNGLVGATPEWWRAAELEIVWSPKEDGTEGFIHTISSPEGHQDLVQTTDEIHEATFKLADLFKLHGKQWKKVVYKIRQNEGGKWHYQADFSY